MKAKVGEITVVENNGDLCGTVEIDDGAGNTFVHPWTRTEGFIARLDMQALDGSRLKNDKGTDDLVEYVETSIDSYLEHNGYNRADYCDECDSPVDKDKYKANKGLCEGCLAKEND